MYIYLPIKSSKRLRNYINELFMSPKSLLTVQKLAGLLELGDLLLILYPKIGMNKYLLSGQGKLFFPSIAYSMHLIFPN